MSHPRIIIGIPTISRFDLLSRLITSINEQTRKPDLIFVIDNSNGGYKKTQDNIEVFKTNNLGVAGSWNFMMKIVPQDSLLILVNDDNELLPNCLENFEKLYLKHPYEGFYSASQNRSFSLFGLIPGIASNLIGYFDECFYPAYCEDNDYHYRMKLKNIDFKFLDTPVFNIGVNNIPSQTLKDLNISKELKETIIKGAEMNRIRYINKWGGMPHKEIFKTPYNLNYDNIKTK